MSGHTPGPWRAVRTSGLRQSIKQGNDMATLAYLTARPFAHSANFTHEQIAANARLIAAAPDQHKALCNAPPLPQGFMEDMTREEQLEWLCTYADWWKDERGPAIDKAEGR